MEGRGRERNKEKRGRVRKRERCRPLSGAPVVCVPLLGTCGWFLSQSGHDSAQVAYF